MIPRPLHARYTTGDESRKYATEPDSILVGPLSPTSGKSRVPSAIMPMVPKPSAELGYLIGSGKTSLYIIGQAQLILPDGSPPRLWIGARFAEILKASAKIRTTSCVSVVHSNFSELALPASSAPSSLFRVISLSRLLQAASAVALGTAWSFVTIATILFLNFDGSVALVRLPLCFEFRLLDRSVVNEGTWRHMDYLNSLGYDQAMFCVARTN